MRGDPPSLAGPGTTATRTWTGGSGRTWPSGPCSGRWPGCSSLLWRSGFDGELVFELRSAADDADPAASDWWTVEIRGRKATARGGPRLRSRSDDPRRPRGVRAAGGGRGASRAGVDRRADRSRGRRHARGSHPGHVRLRRADRRARLVWAGGGALKEIRPDGGAHGDRGRRARPGRADALRPSTSIVHHTPGTASSHPREAAARTPAPAAEAPWFGSPTFPIWSLCSSRAPHPTIHQAPVRSRWPLTDRRSIRATARCIATARPGRPHPGGRTPPVRVSKVGPVARPCNTTTTISRVIGRMMRAGPNDAHDAAQIPTTRRSH